MTRRNRPMYLDRSRCRTRIGFAFRLWRWGVPLRHAWQSSGPGGVNPADAYRILYPVIFGKRPEWTKTLEEAREWMDEELTEEEPLRFSFEPTPVVLNVSDPEAEIERILGRSFARLSDGRLVSDE